MSGIICKKTIEEVRFRNDIVEVIDSYLNLQKSGASYKAACPFHKEKTPSFMVNPQRQIFHCFGCSEGGDLYKFVMLYEGIDFAAAVTMLAKRGGITIEYEKGTGGPGEDKSALYDLMDEVSNFYRRVLVESSAGERAREYLAARELTEETLKDFLIGCAPDRWDAILTWARKHERTNKDLEEVGLILKSTKPGAAGRYYDRFRNRIIFPISNDRGNVVAFGARVMDDSLPKYINSPETPIYSKSNVLYGLNFSKKGIREKGFVVIVEGYLDVIVPYQYGVNNLVATSGTALTSRQVSLLKKYTKSAVMLFDADQAGEAASLRGLDILLEHDMEVKISTLPKGEDPDSFVCKCE